MFQSIPFHFPCPKTFLSHSLGGESGGQRTSLSPMYNVYENFQSMSIEDHEVIITQSSPNEFVMCTLSSLLAQVSSNSIHLYQGHTSKESPTLVIDLQRRKGTCPCFIQATALSQLCLCVMLLFCCSGKVLCQRAMQGRKEFILAQSSRRPTSLEMWILGPASGKSYIWHIYKHIPE